MKLGIAVVYLFGDENAGLLDLHLKQIEKHTRVPYVIHGSANRLAPAHRDRLARQPRVRLYDLPETSLREGDEHAYYLDHLVRLASEDGATHIAILHLDSFPVRPGWAEALDARLSDTCAMVTPEGIHTACLFFRREFYERFHPPLRLPEAVRAGPEYGRFLRRHRPVEHTGIGYGFTAYANGLSWHTLRQTQGGGLYDHGIVYEDAIFHLLGAVWMGEASPPRVGMRGTLPYRRLMCAAGTAYRHFLPVPLRKHLRAWLSAPFRWLVDGPRAVDRNARVKDAMRRMMADFDAYLATLPRR